MDDYDEVSSSNAQMDNLDSLISEFNETSRQELTKISLDPLYNSILMSSLVDTNGINYIQVGNSYIDELVYNEAYESLLETYPDLLNDLNRWFIDRILDIWSEIFKFDLMDSNVHMNTDDLLDRCYAIYDIITSISSNIHLFVLRRYDDRKINPTYLKKAFSQNIPRLVEESISDFINVDVSIEDNSLDNPIYGHILEEDVLKNAKDIFSESLPVNILCNVMEIFLLNINRIGGNKNSFFTNANLEYDNFSMIFMEICVNFAQMFEERYLMNTKSEEDE